ncbi:MAG TPA: hypothetical protein VGD23_03840 [Sphingomicrobium sp.]
MIFLLALETLRLAHPGSPIGAYQNCLAPIVSANEHADQKAYQPLEKILDRIKAECAKERQLAAEALAGAILEQNPALRPLPTAAEKEELIDDATIRWANNVVARMVAGDNE